LRVRQEPRADDRVATFAPAIGPTIGGYLTENYGWQYIFFINLVPGAVMVAGLVATLEPQPIRLDLLKSGDWFGIGAMAIGLGALQTVLEEGNKDDWFGSPLIVRLAITAAVFLTLFIVIELRGRNPAVNIRLLFRRNFGLGTLANFLFGFALYGSVYILPQYLGQVHGYNSEQIGAVMAWIGLPQLLLIPLVPKLMGKFDIRAIVSVGLCIFAGSCLMNIHMSADYAGDQMWVPNVIRAVGHGRHRARGVRGGIRRVQYVAQLGWCVRHSHSRHHHHQARTVPLEHHRKRGDALARDRS
jgi:DHA2 family multidrug resistance protein